MLSYILFSMKNANEFKMNCTLTSPSYTGKPKLFCSAFRNLGWSAAIGKCTRIEWHLYYCTNQKTGYYLSGCVYIHNTIFQLHVIYFTKKCSYAIKDVNKMQNNFMIFFPIPVSVNKQSGPQYVYINQGCFIHSRSPIPRGCMT